MIQATNTTKALAPQQARFLTIRDLLRKHESELIALAGDALDGKRMLDLALSITRRDDKLLECTPQSLLRAARTCAQLRLEPIGRGGVYLIPFRNKGVMECTPITDYRGEITLCVRSGFCEDIKPVLVFERDAFIVREGTEQRIEHVPADGDRGEEKCVYAVALLASGRYTFDVLDKREIDRRRSMSRAKDRGPWVDHYWRMAMKSAVRAIANRMAKSSVPRDAKLARAYAEHIQREEAVEFGFEDVVLDIEEETDPDQLPKSATESLAEKLQRKRAVDDASAEYERGIEDAPLK